MPSLTRSPWFSALAAYFIWGAFPLFWRLFKEVPAFEIVLQRMIWSTVFLALVTALVRREKIGAELRAGWADRKILIPSSLLIGVNWLTYVWAVNHGHVLEASLGYFICPFVQMLLGRLFHGEKLARAQTAAIAVSFAGVSWIALSDGLAAFPWIAFALAISFAVYGSIKKPRPGRPGIPPVRGAFFESALLAVPALVLLAGRISAPVLSGFYLSPRFWILSAIGGALTALPLILYSSAAKRLPLSALGFLQFLNPTIQFGLAVTVFGETFSPAKGVGFGLIWTGAAIYLAAQLSRSPAPVEAFSPVLRSA